MAKEFVNRKSAAGRKAYAKILKRIAEDSVCPFCEPNFLKYHTLPILKKGVHWIVTENMNPYKGTKTHVLFVHRGHLEDITKLSPAAAAELFKLARWIKTTRKLPGAGLFMRMGDMRYTGASVAHLHANLISGAVQDTHEPIAVTLGFKK